WFAACYLLLFASLAGCVLPRAFRLAGSARQQPPRARRNLSRLPLAASYTTALEPAAAVQAAGQLLAGRRFRLRTGDGWVAAEKGYLREVGNLLFHIALLALLGSVGLGAIFGYKANRLVVAGDSVANTPPGRRSPSRWTSSRRAMSPPDPTSPSRCSSMPRCATRCRQAARCGATACGLTIRWSSTASACTSSGTATHRSSRSPMAPARWFSTTRCRSSPWTRTD